MKFIVKCHVFGLTHCWVYSVEWQKRGLPHAHILIWLIEKVSLDQIDLVISAEIPDIKIDPELHKIVTNNMIHRLCDSPKNDSPCVSDGKCTKRYPRDFRTETIIGKERYPLYRRRSSENGGKLTTVKIGNMHVKVDNRWVIPYSPLLAKTYAHINVEYCNSLKSINHICKYVNKVSNMTGFGSANATTSNNEIEKYQLGRYISSSEAMWRILSFPIDRRRPSIFRFPVYLENGQRVYFTAENARERAMSPPPTMLTAFFSLCKDDMFAKTLLYSEVPAYYTWNVSEKKFQRRKKGKEVEGHPKFYWRDVLGRLLTVHPNNAECYYLRSLLINVRGPTSIQELKTVYRKVCTTYREACQELNLLENDVLWDSSLADISNTDSPQQIRTLFAIILIHASHPTQKLFGKNTKTA